MNERADSDFDANPSGTTADATADRAEPPVRAFLRDAIVFHGKLLLDGVRDFVLFPVSVVAALVDLVKRDEPVGARFYGVIHFARETEQWIDLFEAADRTPATDRPRPNISGPSLDEFVDEFETKLRDQYESGELSESARQKVEQLLAAAKNALDGSRKRD